MTDVILTRPSWGAETGDTIEVARDRAAQLVASGVARYPDDGEHKPSSRPASIDSILADVGDDKAKAQAALAAENDRSDPRSTLVSKLQAIIAS